MNDGGVADLAKSMDVIDILLASLRDLAEAGRIDLACSYAGRACAAFRDSDPVTSSRFSILLHKLARDHKPVVRSTVERTRS